MRISSGRDGSTPDRDAMWNFCLPKHLVLDWFAERMHQAVRPAEYGGRQHEVQGLKLGKTDVRQRLRVSLRCFRRRHRQMGGEIEDGLKVLIEFGVEPIGENGVDHVSPLGMADEPGGMDGGAVDAAIDDGSSSGA